MLPDKDVAAGGLVPGMVVKQSPQQVLHDGQCRSEPLQVLWSDLPHVSSDRPPMPKGIDDCP
jgi:hypothetical protein